jgi:molybdopterin/thiamine biosynthesis adenylyltransferase
MRAKLGQGSKELSTLLLNLHESGLISNIRQIDIKNSLAQKRGAIITVEGDIQVEGQIVQIQVGLDPWFPHSLPIIVLIPWDALGFIPHVEADGYTCYAQTEGVLLDRHDPKGILESAIEKAINVLASGVKGNNRWDFIDEFEAYWRNVSGAIEILSMVTPDNNIREISAGKKENASNEKNKYQYVGDDATNINQYFNESDLNRYTHWNALYIPLKPGTYIQPPKPGTSVDCDFFRKIINDNLTPKDIKRIQKLTKKPKREELVIFRLPRPSGGEVIFGALFEDVTNGYPLFSGSSAKKIAPLVVNRRDKAFLLPRGGANSSLQEKRVAIFGCGSVGGFLTFDLIRSGVIDLTLVDNDILSADNTFRHVLGRKGMGKSKVDAMKEEIQKSFPFVKVSAFAMTAQEVFSSGLIDVKRFDIILIAIGDNNVSLFLNEYFHGQKQTPPVAFTWLEPYGIGGHVLVMNKLNESGCFECLFTADPNDKHPTFGNRASFAAHNQTFSKDISGCANRFTPYGSHDASRTAALASRLAIEVLLGKLQGNPLVSWKGDSTEFLNAGYFLSPRYRLNEEEIEKTQYLYFNPNCPICGDKREL